MAERDDDFDDFDEGAEDDYGEGEGEGEGVGGGVGGVGGVGGGGGGGYEDDDGDDRQEEEDDDDDEGGGGEVAAAAAAATAAAAGGVGGEVGEDEEYGEDAEGEYGEDDIGEEEEEEEEYGEGAGYDDDEGAGPSGEEGSEGFSGEDDAEADSREFALTATEAEAEEDARRRVRAERGVPGADAAGDAEYEEYDPEYTRSGRAPRRLDRAAGARLSFYGASLASLGSLPSFPSLSSMPPGFGGPPSTVPPRRAPPGLPVRSGSILSTASRSAASTGDLDELRTGMPVGLKMSRLARVAGCGTHLLSRRSLPQVDPTGLRLFDLHRDTAKGSGVLPDYHSVQAFLVTVLRADDVDPPNEVARQNVVARRVRMCLFDSAKRGDTSSASPFRSNVHGMPAEVRDRRARRWDVRERRGVLLPRPHENAFLVRVGEDILSPTLAVLFELCLFVKRRAADGSMHQGELSTGWAEFRFLDGSLQMRNVFGLHRLPLSPGAAGEGAGRPVSAADRRRKVAGPALLIKVSKLDRTTLHTQAKLPATVVTSLSTMELVSVWRECLADSLLTVDSATGREGPPRLAPAVHPELAVFLHILNNPDLLEFFKALWTNKRKSRKLSRAQRRDMRPWAADSELQKVMFRRTCAQMWGTLQIRDLPLDIVGDESASETRFNMLMPFILTPQSRGDRQLPPESNVTENPSDFAYRPFHLDEVIFDPLPPRPLDELRRAPPIAFFSPAAAHGRPESDVDGVA